MNEQITIYINNANDEQKEMMQKIRKIIHSSVEGVEEEFKWSRPVFKKEKDFAYLKSAKNHLTLGFYNREKLEDPKHLLEGSGKMMKHIKLKDISDVDEDLISAWIKSLNE